MFADLAHHADLVVAPLMLHKTGGPAAVSLRWRLTQGVRCSFDLYPAMQVINPN
jgi:hypothetical protein